MKKLSLILSTVLLTAAVPFTASADPSDNWNISTNPIGLILGVNADLQYKIADDVTIGPNISFISYTLDDVKLQGLEVGFNADYYFDQAFKTGWYLRGGVAYESAKASASDDFSSASATINAFEIKGLGGYKWFWGNFNLTLGLGLGLNFPSKTELTSSDGTTDRDIPIHTASIIGDASIGWSF